MFGRIGQALAVAGFLYSWSLSARADGKIDIAEVEDLLRTLGELLQIKELATMSIEVDPVELPNPPRQGPSQRWNNP